MSLGPRGQGGLLPIEPCLVLTRSDPGASAAAPELVFPRTVVIFLVPSNPSARRRCDRAGGAPAPGSASHDFPAGGKFLSVLPSRPRLGARRKAAPFALQALGLKPGLVAGDRPRQPARRTLPGEAVRVPPELDEMLRRRLPGSER